MNRAIKSTVSILLAAVLILAGFPGAALGVHAAGIWDCDHVFTAEEIPATCMSYAHTRHTCTQCGYAYKAYDDSQYSQWEPVYPADAPATQVEQKTQYRWSDSDGAEGWTDWSDWSDVLRAESDVRKVETRTVYRYLTAEYGPHNFENGTCSVCGDAGMEDIFELTEVSVGRVSAQPGETVTIPVTVESNLGFAAFSLEIRYDERVMLLTGIQPGPVLEASETGTFTGDADRSTVSWDDDRNTTGNGILLELTFRIPEGAKSGVYPVGIGFKNQNSHHFRDQNGRTGKVTFVAGQVALRPHDHDYTSNVTAPTCTEPGFTTYTCRCGDSYTADETPALGHDFGEGLCARCGASDPDYSAPVENPFADVKEGDYFLDPVLWAVERQITVGTSATAFSPNNPCTRAQIVTFLWRANGCPKPASDENPFEDVAETDYFYQAVLWAVEQKITVGMSATSFGPHLTCTRGQVATFLWRFAGEPEPEDQAAENPFNDVDESLYYCEPILWAVEQGITLGMGNGRFAPNNNCTRAQIVTFLYRALKDR